MKDQYIQSWENEVSNNSICYNYRMFKTIFCYEQYLSTLERPLRDYLIRIRLSNHRLPIHSKRFVDIPRNERLCELCNLGEIGDEYHYIFVCKDERIVRERNVNIKQYYRNRPNAMKYQRVMNTKQVGSLRRLARFSGHIMKLFQKKSRVVLTSFVLHITLLHSLYLMKRFILTCVIYLQAVAAYILHVCEWIPVYL